MTRVAATCPNCGAPIEFRWSGAVQTTCGFCRSILVRHDVDLERMGTMADLPPSVSPIQVGAEGRYAGRAFEVVGRIVYEYERGRWNEWHLRLGEESAWLSDAQAEYAVTRRREPPAGVVLPHASALRVGWTLVLDGVRHAVTTLTRARYRAVEGELPFTTWDRSEALFADLEADAAADGGARFATIDYSDGDDAPLLFTGEYVELDDLRMTNLREIEGW